MPRSILLLAFVAMVVITPSLTAADSFDLKDAPLKRVRDVGRLVTSCTFRKDDAARWATLVRRISRGELEPTVVVISFQDTNDSIAAVFGGVLDIDSAAVVGVQIAAENRPTDNPTDAPNRAAFVLSASLVDAYRGKEKIAPDIGGVYVYGQGGRLVWWWTGEVYDAPLHEANVVIRALTAAAAVRRAIATATVTPTKLGTILSSQVIPLSGTAFGAKSLSELFGRSQRPLLLSIWATWCPSCQRELPLLDELQVEYGNRLQYVGLLTDTQDPEIRKKMRNTTPSRLRSQQFGLLDNNVVMRLFPEHRGLRVANLPVPLNVLLSPDGDVMFQTTGAILRESSELRALRKALDQPITQKRRAER